MLRPRVRDEFLRTGASFDYDLAELGFRLRGEQCSIYDEGIDAVLLRSKRHGNIIANNTYVSSFAYNLAVAWLAYGREYEAFRRRDDCALTRLLRYNLKKFFAEQILSRTHSVFGLGIFLETLLYEERAMRPLFAASAGDPILEARYQYFGDLMSNLLLFHEVGHLVRDARADMEELLLAEIRGAADAPFAADWSEYPDPGRTEFLCDTFSLLMASRNVPSCADAVFVLRAIAFGFAMCACMYGLEKSAAATALAYPASGDRDTLGEIHASLPGASFVIGIDQSAVVRARSALRVCEVLAGQQGIDLYAPDGDFPLFPDVIETTTAFATTVVTDQDPQIRGLCELLARAFHGHDRGVDYLMSRSKVFKMPPGDSASFT